MNAWRGPRVYRIACGSIASTLTSKPERMFRPCGSEPRLDAWNFVRRPAWISKRFMIKSRPGSESDQGRMSKSYRQRQELSRQDIICALAMYRDAPPRTLVFRGLPCLESTTFGQQEKRSFASDDVKRDPTFRVMRGKRTAAASPVDIAQGWLDERIGVIMQASVDLPSCQEERKSAKGTHHVPQNTTECSETRASPTVAIRRVRIASGRRSLHYVIWIADANRESEEGRQTTYRFEDRRTYAAVDGPPKHAQRIALATFLKNACQIRPHAFKIALPRSSAPVPSVRLVVALRVDEQERVEAWSACGLDATDVRRTFSCTTTGSLDSTYVPTASSGGAPAGTVITEGVMATRSRGDGVERTRMRAC
ncbi:hypothetical protein C8Q76DRAFT_697869 [Earliella scabrosa]|nr:hypothetical protein C8Q76DRAFT_697869 [Earliella scabrosa]